MRTLVVGLLLGQFSVVPAAGYASFEPFASSPDHVVTMIETDGPGKTQERVVTHHGEWTRVETVFEGRRVTQYFKRDEEVTVLISGGKADEYATVSISRGSERGSAWDYTPIKTGERQTLLGEACTVWDVMRVRDPGSGRPQLTRTSCVTDDGIELCYKVVSGSDEYSRAEASRVERRPVAPSDTHPPQNLLAPDWWKPESPSPAAAAVLPEFETTMERTGGNAAQKLTRTIRRHGGWLYTEDMMGDVRGRLTIENAGRGLTFRLETDAKGAPKQLTMLQAPAPDPAKPAVFPKAPMPLGKRETILGEACEWFDLMPDVADAGLAECRTRDAIPLKQIWSGRAGGPTFTAVRFARRAVGLHEVTPSAVLLERKTWDLPE